MQRPGATSTENGMEWYDAWQHIGDFCVLCCGRITQAPCCCQVHDFIHTYIYMDFIELVKLPKFTSMMLSFIKIGRASCRERVCQYVLISVVDVSLKKKK